MHYCQYCGAQHGEEMEAAGTAVETGTEITEGVAEEITDASVEIAKIEATRDVTIAKVEAGVAETELESRLSELEGEIRGMREVLDRIAPEPDPEPEPAPVVVQEVASEPEPELPPREESHEPRAPRRKTGFFG